MIMDITKVRKEDVMRKLLTKHLRKFDPKYRKGGIYFACWSFIFKVDASDFDSNTK